MSEPTTALSHQKLTVIGAGMMGHGIATQAARCGAQAELYDTQEAALERELNHIKQSYNRTLEKGKIRDKVCRGELEKKSVQGFCEYWDIMSTDVL